MVAGHGVQGERASLILFSGLFFVYSLVMYWWFQGTISGGLSTSLVLLASGPVVRAYV